MKNGQNHAPPPTPRRHKHTDQQRFPLSQINRIQQLKDKKAIYPQSTLNKIVFISNLSGTGFKKQNFCLYDVPVHIDLEKMINSINKVCLNQWRISFETLEAQPLFRYERFQTIIGYLVILVIVVMIFFIFPFQLNISKYFAYIFLGLIGLGCIYSVFLMAQKRVEINIDAEMIRAIKKELIRLNSKQKRNFAHCPRFRWTCHKDCLWIACEFI